jgi:hypothetical protein
MNPVGIALFFLKQHGHGVDTPALTHVPSCGIAGLNKRKARYRGNFVVSF